MILPFQSIRGSIGMFDRNYSTVLMPVADFESHAGRWDKIIESPEAN